MSSARTHRLPRDTDVIVGRGLAIACRLGNKQLRKFVLEHQHDYHQIKRTNKKEMTRFVDRLIDNIHGQGILFFMIDESNNYHIVSAAEMSKTKNSYRIIRRKIQRLLNPSKVPKIVNTPGGTNTNSNSRSGKNETSYFLRSSTNSMQMPCSITTAQSPHFNRDINDEMTWWRDDKFFDHNPDLEAAVWSICDDLYMNTFVLPGRRKHKGREKGIVVTVDRPRGNRAIANLDRPAYLRQQFVDPQSSCEVSDEGNTILRCYPYGFGTGTTSVGTPPR